MLQPAASNLSPGAWTEVLLLLDFRVQLALIIAITVVIVAGLFAFRRHGIAFRRKTGSVETVLAVVLPPLDLLVDSTDQTDERYANLPTAPREKWEAS
jgi:hypothetical protein